VIKQKAEAKPKANALASKLPWRQILLGAASFGQYFNDVSF
jgi:hypothetical protein